MTVFTLQWRKHAPFCWRKSVENEEACLLPYHTTMHDVVMDPWTQFRQNGPHWLLSYFKHERKPNKISQYLTDPITPKRDYHHLSGLPPYHSLKLASDKYAFVVSLQLLERTSWNSKPSHYCTHEAIWSVLNNGGSMVAEHYSIHRDRWKSTKMPMVLDWRGQIAVRSTWSQHSCTGFQRNREICWVRKSVFIPGYDIITCGQQSPAKMLSTMPSALVENVSISL